MLRLAIQRLRRAVAGLQWTLRQVPKKVWIAARPPVRRTVILDARPRTGCTEERVLSRVHNDADVPAPHDQITRMRVAHAQEWARPAVKIERAGVRIGIPRLPIE